VLALRSIPRRTHDSVRCMCMHARVQVLDQLLQPLLAVRQSPHLDALERAVMATVLYHSGELRVLHSAGVDRVRVLASSCLCRCPCPGPCLRLYLCLTLCHNGSSAN